MTVSCNKTGVTCMVVGVMLAVIGFISIPVFQWFIRREIIKVCMLQVGVKIHFSNTDAMFIQGGCVKPGTKVK